MATGLLDTGYGDQEQPEQGTEQRTAPDASALTRVQRGWQGIAGKAAVILGMLGSSADRSFVQQAEGAPPTSKSGSKKLYNEKGLRVPRGFEERAVQPTAKGSPLPEQRAKKIPAVAISDIEDLSNTAHISVIQLQQTSDGVFSLPALPLEKNGVGLRGPSVYPPPEHLLIPVAIDHVIKLRTSPGKPVRLDHVFPYIRDLGECSLHKADVIIDAGAMSSLKQEMNVIRSKDR